MAADDRRSIVTAAPLWRPPADAKLTTALFNRLNCAVDRLGHRMGHSGAQVVPRDRIGTFRPEDQEGQDEAYVLYQESG